MNYSMAGFPVLPSPTLRACSNSCPLSRWCHSTISFSIVPFSFHLQSFLRVFSNKSVLRIQWPKYWSFSLSISPFYEHSGLISLKIDWFDLLEIQGTLEEFSPTTQKHPFFNITKASILWCSTFFMVQLSHPYMTTGKTIALTIWSFVGKVMSLLFNILSRLVIIFLPRNNCLLIS